MEKYQIERINLIKEILPMLGDNFILKGGTALTLFYGCNRFSEDIDLDAKTNNMNFIDKLKNPHYDTWNISVKKDTPTVFRAMIDYGAKSDKGDYPLKIEVSSRNAQFLSKGLMKYTKIDGVNIYDISELIDMKVGAMLSRTKARDVFDVGYLLEKYPSLFNIKQVKEIVSNMNIKGLDNLSYSLKIEEQEHKLSGVDADSYVLDMYYRAESLWSKLNDRTIDGNKGNRESKEKGGLEL